MELAQAELRILVATCRLYGDSNRMSCPVAIIALNAPTDGYSKLYGTAPLAVGSLLTRYAKTLSPFHSVGANANLLVVLTLASFVVLVVRGRRLYHLGEARRTHSSLLLSFACAVPLLGVISYLPWPAL